jgi:hypothetical protein
MTPILTKSFRAATASGGHLFIAAQAGAGVAEAAASTDAIIGVSDQMGAAAGRMLDVVQLGWAELKIGGNVDFGDLLTADDEGRGVKAEPEAGEQVRTGAVAMSDGAEGDIIPVYVTLGVIATPAAG